MKTQEDTVKGRFDWIERMGVHEAYHQNPINRWIHWICIPLELWSIIKFLSLIRFADYNLALLVVLVVSLIYILVDLVAGMAMTFFLFIMLTSAVYINMGALWKEILFSVLVFVASFLFQTKIGHGIFEKGVDDTTRNIDEFKKNKDPIPMILIFYYHFLQILFSFGYRTDLFTQMKNYRNLEMEKNRPTIS